MDMDNIVMIMGGRGWVKMKEGIRGIKMVMRKNKWRGQGDVVSLMKTKTTMEYHFTFTRMAIIFLKKDKISVEDWNLYFWQDFVS